MSTYENNIYSNHILNSENSEDLAHLYSEEDANDDSLYNLTGGLSLVNDMETDRPTGGFPPIFVINNIKEKDNERDKSRTRQITTNKNTVSIRDILKSKK